MLSPLAYLELSFYCHHAETEVAAMAISSADDPLYIDRIALVKQRASACYVELDDDAVADHIQACAEQGIAPARCGRIWMHTHPGNSATPSATDEQTFARAFGGCDWSIMFILARGGAIYARLQLASLPGLRIELAVKIDWSAWPAVVPQLLDARPLQTWRKQIDELVELELEPIRRGMWFDYDALDEPDWRDLTEGLHSEHELVHELLEEQEEHHVRD